MISYWMVFALTLAVCLPIAFAEHQAVLNDAGRRNIHVFAGLLLVSLGLFAGLRGPYSDPDYPNYIYWLGSRAGLDWAAVMSKDPLFQLAGMVFRSEQFGLVLFMLVIALGSLALKWRILKSPDYRGLLGLGLLFLISRLFLAHEFVQVRAAIAVSLASLALVLAVEGRGRLSLCLFAVCSQIHASTVLLAPLLLYAYPASARLRALCAAAIVLTVALVLNYTDYAGDIMFRIFPYFSGEYEVTENSLLSLYFLAKIGASIWLLWHWKRLNRGMRLALIACLYGIMWTIVFVDNDVLSLRLSELSAIFDCLCFAYFFTHCFGRYTVAGLCCAAALCFVFYSSVLKIVYDYQLFFA